MSQNQEIDQIEADLKAAVDGIIAARSTKDEGSERAHKARVVQLGERLHVLGGLDLMSKMLDLVAMADPDHEGLRAGIMDHRWDGIGRDASSSGWCS